MAKRPRTGRPKPAKRKTTRKTRTKNKPSRTTPRRKGTNGKAGEPWHRAKGKRPRPQPHR